MYTLIYCLHNIIYKLQGKKIMDNCNEGVLYYLQTFIQVTLLKTKTEEYQN
jgi:hypothetical protein